MSDENDAPESIWILKPDKSMNNMLVLRLVGDIQDRDIEYTLKSSADKREQALREYIEFLGKDYDKLAAVAVVHDMRWSEEDIQKGKRLRKNAGIPENE